MEHNIDLSNYQLKTDLAIESLEYYDKDNTILQDIKTVDDIVITTINVDEAGEKLINKKRGSYVTLTVGDVSDYDKRKKVSKVLIEQIKKLLLLMDIKDNDKGLVIGIGNEKATVDALGSLTINKVMVTRHLFEVGADVKKGIRNVSAFNPGVMGNTGIETFTFIKNVVNSIKPNFVLVVDSLAASSMDRMNKTIQLTNTGIHPGSGVGNGRQELSIETLNVPVIAIGVPTVVNLSTIVDDTLDYLLKHLSYIKDNSNVYKFIFKHSSDYIDKLNSQKELSNEEKKEVLGLVGILTDSERKQLISELLMAINYNLIVTEKGIDDIINYFSEILSDSINNALHRQVTHL
ncbi:MAG: GPR endopeptidase [bacterium]|nr:GPR endopeptidase [bacterium]